MIGRSRRLATIGSGSAGEADGLRVDQARYPVVGQALEQRRAIGRVAGFDDRAIQARAIPHQGVARHSLFDGTPIAGGDPRKERWAPRDQLRPAIHWT